MLVTIKLSPQQKQFYDTLFGTRHHFLSTECQLALNQLDAQKYNSKARQLNIANDFSLQEYTTNYIFCTNQLLLYQSLEDQCTIFEFRTQFFLEALRIIYLYDFNHSDESYDTNLVVNNKNYASEEEYWKFIEEALVESMTWEWDNQKIIDQYLHEFLYLAYAITYRSDLPSPFKHLARNRAENKELLCQVPNVTSKMLNTIDDYFSDIEIALKSKMNATMDKRYPLPWKLLTLSTLAAGTALMLTPITTGLIITSACYLSSAGYSALNPTFSVKADTVKLLFIKANRTIERQPNKKFTLSEMQASFDKSVHYLATENRKILSLKRYDIFNRTKKTTETIHTCFAESQNDIKYSDSGSNLYQCLKKRRIKPLKHQNTSEEAPILNTSTKKIVHWMLSSSTPGKLINLGSNILSHITFANTDKLDTDQLNLINHIDEYGNATKEGDNGFKIHGDGTLHFRLKGNTKRYNWQFFNIGNTEIKDQDGNTKTVPCYECRTYNIK